jgi:hypothetical protein
LAPGEYRSHLYFRSIPNNKPLGEQDPLKDSAISVKLVPVFGISIPVIIRVGENTSAVNLSDLALQLEKGKAPALSMTFNRTGNMSVYGDLAVYHITPQGTATRIAIVKGLGVYTPNALRHFRLDLETNEGIYYHTGKLRVVYSDQSAKSVKLAEAEIDLH